MIKSGIILVSKYVSLLREETICMSGSLALLIFNLFFQVAELYSGSWHGILIVSYNWMTMVRFRK
jgi:hypothetical protein